MVSRYGLPKYVGLLPVDAVINAVIAPLSGINPVSVGQLKSGCVLKNSAHFIYDKEDFKIVLDKFEDII